MRIISVEISDGKIKGAVFKRRGELLELLDYNINRSGKYYISVFYQDFIYSSIILPAVKDEETLFFLLKNRLSDQLESGTEYIILPVRNKEISENQIEYFVYAIPEKLFFDAVKKVGIIDPADVEFFTLSQFSLAGVTSKISEDETVFMIYTDKEKFIITVSHGNRILYTRSTKIPDFVTEEQLVNFYYENFNLTYIYIVQNQGIDIDSVGLAGNISKIKQFVELIRSFSDKPVYTVLPDLFLKNSDFDQFSSYTIQIGALNLSKDYNFLPLKIKQKKTFSNLSRKISLILMLIFLSLSVINAKSFFEVKDKFYSLKSSYTRLKISFEKEIASKNISPEQIKYLIGYINLLSSERKTVYLLDKISGILSILNMENLNITYKDGKRYISIRSEERFTSLNDMEFFKRKLKKEVSKLKDFKIVDRSVFDIDRLSAKIFIELVKEK